MPLLTWPPPLAVAQQINEYTNGERLNREDLIELLQESGKLIVDGDDENDNVINTGATFSRLDFLGMGNRLLPPSVLDVIVSDVGPDAPPPGAEVDTVNAPDFHLNTVDGDGRQVAGVPVGGADTVRVVFSEAIDDTTISIDSLTLVGIRTGTKPLPSAFESPTEANNFTATWNFPAAFSTIDYYLLSLPDTITDMDNNALDGEWINPGRLFENPAVPEEGFFDEEGDAVSMFPSGDGTAGGDFNFVLTFFPGNVGADLVIDTNDLIPVLNNFFGPGGWEQGDFNGNGITDSEDLIFVLNQFFFQLDVMVRWKGDYNNSGMVTLADEALWETIAENDPAGDFNRDGVTNELDRALLLNQIDLYFDSIG